MLNNNLENQNQASRNRTIRFLLWFVRLLLFCATLFFILNPFLSIVPILILPTVASTAASIVIGVFFFVMLLASFCIDPNRASLDPGPGGGSGDGINIERANNDNVPLMDDRGHYHTIN